MAIAISGPPLLLLNGRYSFKTPDKSSRLMFCGPSLLPLLDSAENRVFPDGYVIVKAAPLRASTGEWVVLVDKADAKGKHKKKK